jgi:DNA-binding MarR family transcriptional regulator
MARRNTLQLDHFLPYRLSVLSNLTSGAISASYALRFKLSIPEWRVLAVLGTGAELSAAEVALRTAMDKVAVSRAVSSLLRARRISRTISIHDRRRSALRLTRAGHQVYSEVVPVARRYEQDLLRTLGSADRKSLDRILRSLLARAVKIGPAELS